MNDIRRTTLWIIFSASLFLIYDAWQRHNGQPSMFMPTPARTAASAPAAPPVPVGTATQAQGGIPGGPLHTGSTTATAASAAVPGSPPLPSTGVASASAGGQTVEVVTDVVKATLDSTGGTVVHLELVGQKDQNDRSRDVVLFDRSPQRLYLAQTGLVPAAGGSGLPNHHTPMRAVPGPRTLAPGDDAVAVRFESEPVGGVVLAKTYTFKRGDYVVDVRHEVSNRGDAPTTPRIYLQLVRDGNPPPGESSLYFTFTGPAVYTDSGRFQKVDFSSIEKHRPGAKPDHVQAADTGWVAMVQHYYASAWLADRPGTPAPRKEFFTGKVDTNAYSVGMLMPLGEIAPGATRTFDARLFAGPQEEDKLAALAPDLDLVKDYGWFTILSKPLFWLLTKLHDVLGNWGWAIVGLVVLLKIAFYWLNATAYRSMAKMKAINPRIMEMRERLKDKPQQMQQEMMRIYREEKVNPLGGCLPIFVQMPFFIALYWVLLSTVEMRNAPWIGWITDLSAKDPYFILPILMTLTSLLQTWLNPTPPDPIQAKMMWIMPLMFSVMFFFFPAGLVLYWLVNNLFSIAQQYLINKRLGVLGK